MAIGQYEKAAKDYMHFLKGHPTDGKVWSYLVEVLALAGNTKAALDAAQKGLSTGSHWSKRLMSLREKIITGKPIISHTPFSN
ncbi:tetratricopeptide repeat protein [Desulfobacter latus]|uniref:Tetratricopeptide repeat protein n=1 Tax=Desulfobacter latus TaxID=2292 RepID=A0A850T7I8_9BACT|nr:hypothetical protein [Desulfobacter latus]NWH05035.1 hypothetical protein [Desulfobacter latus]